MKKAAAGTWAALIQPFGWVTINMADIQDVSSLDSAR